MRTRRLVLRLCYVIAVAGCAEAQAQHLALIGGPVELRITSLLFGGAATGSDATTWIEWEGYRQPKKITIETSALGQTFALEAELIGFAGTGTALPAVALTDGMWPQDFVRDIKNRQHGGGYVRYTATAAAEDGHSVPGGEDAHLITFTLIDQ